METAFYLSIALNIALLAFICYKWRSKKQANKLEDIQPEEKQTPVQDSSSAPITIWNAHLRELAQKCEEKLPLEDRGLIKILIEREHPDFPAILKVGDIMLSIKREESNISQFEVTTPREALVLARDGYNTTARYLLVPKELEFVLQHYKAINIYLDALGLETINPKNKFWSINTSTSWYSGWKRFNWNIDTALKHYNGFFMTVSEKGCTFEVHQAKAKLLLKLSGWEHLFCEV